MTYEEFKRKYDGKYIDYDKQHGYQCWDLGEQYAVECLGIPEYVLAGCGNVRNLLVEPKINDMLEYFDEVDEYNLWSGDLVIFEYGHICIFDGWDGHDCWYFSQNPNPCKVMKINAGGVHGFRLKQNINSDDNKKDETKEYDVTGKVIINGDDLTLNLKINR